MTAPRSGEVSYGVDVGGTKILAVALDGAGSVLAQRRVPTPHGAASSAARGRSGRSRGASGDAPHDEGGDAPHGEGGGGDGAEHPGEAVADAVAAILVELRREVAACASRRQVAPGVSTRDTGSDPGPVPVGVGIAGLVDAAGVLRFSPNLATASGADVGELVTGRLGEDFGGTVVRAHNDANCAALAELLLGSARGMRDGLVITLGTGIGGALVVDGAVSLGSRGFAGEAGHMVVDPNGPPCPCGNRGCWERFASGGGLARLAREAALAGTLGEAVRLAGGDPELVTGEHVTAAAAAGDRGALGVMGELGWWVGLGLANLVAIFDPEWIVLGGGLGHAGEMLLEPARQALTVLVEGGAARGPVPVVEAALGEQAGAVGAALAARTGALDGH